MLVEQPQSFTRRAHWDEASLILAGDCLSVLPMDKDDLHAINMLCESVAAQSVELAMGSSQKHWTRRSQDG